MESRFESAQGAGGMEKESAEKGAARESPGQRLWIPMDRDQPARVDSFWTRVSITALTLSAIGPAGSPSLEMISFSLATWSATMVLMLEAPSAGTLPMASFRASALGRSSCSLGRAASAPAASLMPEMRVPALVNRLVTSEPRFRVSGRVAGTLTPVWRFLRASFPVPWRNC